MGIIQRQAAKASVIRYVGVIIGMLSTVFIYPFELELYGLIRFLLDNAVFLIPLGSLGFIQAGVRYFPLFKNPAKGHHGVLGLLLLLALGGSLLISLLLVIFSPFIYDYFSDNSPLLLHYLPVVLLLFLPNVFFELLRIYSTIFQRIVVPTLINLAIRIMVPVSVLLYAYNFIGIGTSIGLLVATYILMVFMMIVYVKQVLKQWHLRIDWAFLKEQWKRKRTKAEKNDNKLYLRESIEYSIYTILYIIGTTVSVRVDAIMVTSYLGLVSNGVYSIAYLLAMVISIPQQLVTRIVGPILAQKSSENDNKAIADLYYKVSINLLVIGILFFGLIWGNIDLLFEVHPKGSSLEAGRYVIWAIGLSVLVDMSMALSGAIITYSRLFRFNLIILFITAVINVILNVILIPLYGLFGAALASLLSLALIRIIRTIYVWIHFKMHPFSVKMGILIVVGLLSYFVAFRLIDTGSLYANVVVQSGVFVLFYLVPVFMLQISEDINQMARKYLKFL